MADFLEEARRQIEAEDREALQARIEDRARKLAREAEEARLAVPPSLAEEEQRLAELIAQRDAILEREKQRNPYRISEHDALMAVKRQVYTIEKSVTVRRRLAGKAA